ncbi:hypothetical protein HMPREF9005_0400, partial [Actinomyces sp. oral taxon 178 str. F0338]
MVAVRARAGLDGDGDDDALVRQGSGQCLQPRGAVVRALPERQGGRGPFHGLARVGPVAGGHR